MTDSHTTATTPDPPTDRDHTVQSLERLRQEVGKIVIGQHTVIDQMLTALIARGHCLLIGVPGLAKTVMAKAMADCLDMQFQRVQFTPDLMPSDITGTNVLDEDPTTGRKTFRFLPGPLFTNILLADEINRTPPKTQSALLEAMQESTVTIAGDRRELPRPFFVLATQNPLEQEGTYPLPEAQLDRFMFSVIVTYPTHAEENQIVEATTRRSDVQLHPTLNADDIAAMQEQVRRSGTPPHVARYAVRLARATRPQEQTAPQFVQQYVDCGAGPRAGQYLVLAAKSHAVLQGRTEPTIEDIQQAAVPVLRHRVFTNFTALSENLTADELIEHLVGTVPTEASGDPIVYAPTPPTDAPLPQINDEMSAVAAIKAMATITEHIRAQVQQVIIGQDEVLDLMLGALLAGGHCLLVGVPGLAKTTLVRTLADVLDLDFKRVQFTPDLMPSDITGTDVMEVDEDTGERTFRFIQGPVFTNLLLADEINRTPPKTQASLLEAMQEHSVTAGNTTYDLTEPFFVLATQNPLEQEGTYPLPEAQLDRFMFMIYMDYPTETEEPIIVDRTTGGFEAQPAPVITAEQIVRLQQIVRQVPISNHVLTYATTLVRATRPETPTAPDMIRQYVHCGAGPRACQYLVLGAKARAVMQGRPNVSVSDIKAVAVPVLRHRIFTNFAADAEGVTSMEIVQKLVSSLPEPRIADEKALADNREPDILAITCPKCATSLRVSAKSAGKRAKCNHCGATFRINR